MSKANQIIILGYSGHSYNVIETIIKLGFKILGYFDCEEKQFNPYNIKYLGDENKIDSKNFKNSENSYFISIGDNYLRREKGEFLNALGLHQPNIIHPNATISDSLNIGYGNLINSNVVINSQVSIGNNVIINTGTIVEHECKISNNVHLAPGSILCGAVQIKKNSFIGANTIINPNIKIGKNVIIGSGSIILSDVKDGEKVYGIYNKPKS